MSLCSEQLAQLYSMNLVLKTIEIKRLWLGAESIEERIFLNNQLKKIEQLTLNPKRGSL
jgi:hypothetical protein